MSASFRINESQVVLPTDTSFSVLVVSPDAPVASIIVIGGILEHYLFMYRPLLKALAEAGFEAIGVGVPYEKHFSISDDLASFLSEVAHGATQAASSQPHLVLHSGASVLIDAEQFDQAQFSQIILWSALGLDRPNKHSTQQLFVVSMFVRNMLLIVLRNLLDWRMYVAWFAGVLALVRNLEHLTVVFRVFYGLPLRDKIVKITKVSIAHGAHDALFPFDMSDK